MKKPTQPTFDFDAEPCEQSNGHGQASVPAEGGNRREEVDVATRQTDDADTPVVVAVSTWQEVPAARFLSWSHEMQLAYCAKRDEDSANEALSEEWAEFYRQRARDYRQSL